MNKRKHTEKSQPQNTSIFEALIMTLKNQILIKNKCAIIFYLFYLGLFSQSFAQVKEDIKSYYRLGAGLGIEGNYGLWALNLTHEFSYYASPRFSINPAMTYFVSVADFDLSGNYWKPEFNGDNIDGFVSTLFTDLKFQYDVIKPLMI